MIIAILITVLTTVVGAVYLFYKWTFQYWAKHGFEHTNPSFPWGDVAGMLTTRTMGEVISDIYKQHAGKRFVGFWLLIKPSLLIRDPELVKNILARDFVTFNDRGMHVNERDDPLSAHLVALSGAKWKRMRVKLTPTFTSGKMKSMFPILIETSKKLVDVLRGPVERGEVVEVKDYAARYTTDVISLTSFGIETDSLHNPNAEFRHNGQELFNPTLFESVKMMCMILWPAFSKMFSFRNFRKEITDFFLKAFKESMEYREENKMKRNDFMDLLVQLKEKGFLEGADGESKDGTKFTFEEAAAQAFLFFIAGFETSSTTMQFALYELAKNPEMQSRVRKECNQVLAKHNGEITYESISEMDYLCRIIDETLRMYPPFPMLQRVCQTDYKIPDSDLTIPKGVQVIIDCVGLHHDPAHYPDPERFDPDRFTAEGKASRHNYAYLPFGEGPRNCIGMRFGLMQTRVGLLTMLINFEMSVADKTPMPLVLDPKSFIQSPKGGMPLKLTHIKA